MTAFSNGLHNIGNTCYLNSCVQILRGIDPLRAALSSSPTPFLRQLHDLYRQLDGTVQPVAPKLFWATFVSANPRFAEMEEGRYLMQHDAQEALSVILQQLSLEINNQPRHNHLKRLFVGSLRQKITCPEASTSHEEVVPFTVLPCNITGEVQTLEAGLEQSFEETFTAMAAELGRETAFRRKTELQELPEILFVQLVRFQWKSDVQKKAKILKPINFPMVLDVFNLCAPALKDAMKENREAVRRLRDAEVERRRSTAGKITAQEVPPTAEVLAADKGQQEVPVGNDNGFYELSGVISHKGRDADGGHYVAWVKKGDAWLVLDDPNCAVVTEEDIKRLRGVGEAHIAYVLMYRSRNPLTRQLPLQL
jgi:ubiquitin carboxyl-terminal hydrolase 14